MAKGKVAEKTLSSKKEKHTKKKTDAKKAEKEQKTSTKHAKSSTKSDTKLSKKDKKSSKLSKKHDDDTKEASKSKAAQKLSKKRNDDTKEARKSKTAHKTTTAKPKLAEVKHTKTKTPRNVYNITYVPEGAATDDQADAPAAGRVLQVGTASYYGDAFDGGRTASGERFDQDKLTCAHGSLPFGCKIRVTNLRNHKSVNVKVNDRGGFAKHGRVLDLSKAAAREIGMVSTGTAKVKIEVLN
jgi:rare lipoprotein A